MGITALAHATTLVSQLAPYASDILEHHKNVSTNAKALLLCSARLCSAASALLCSALLCSGSGSCSGSEAEER